jgi:DNA-binding transcriptional MerR regulator
MTIFLFKPKNLKQLYHISVYLQYLFVQLARFSIKDIETVSGIKSHTLRVWEQRYGIIRPKRTDTNIRYYDDQDLKLILNISILNSNGFKISEIAAMSPDEIQQSVLKVSATDRKHDSQVKSLVSTMLTLDEQAFHYILSTNILQIGLEQTFIHVVIPFLHEVGLLWQIGSIHVAHEHFITNLIKQKLYVAVDGQNISPKPGSKKFLLFLREGEPHEIGLLFANFMIRSRGHQVIYLGQSLPHDELQEVFAVYQPEYVLTSLTSSLSSEEFTQFANELSALWPDATVILTGSQLAGRDIQVKPNVTLVNDMAYFTALLDELGRTHLSN